MDLNINPTRSNFRHTFATSYRQPGAFWSHTLMSVAHSVWCSLHLAVVSHSRRCLGASGAKFGEWKSLSDSWKEWSLSISSPEMTSEIPNRKVPNTIFRAAQKCSSSWSSIAVTVVVGYCFYFIFFSRQRMMSALSAGVSGMSGMAVETMLLPFHTTTAALEVISSWRFVGQTGLDLMNGKF